MTDRSSLVEGAERLKPSMIVMDMSYAAGDLPDLMRELRDRAPEGESPVAERARRTRSLRQPSPQVPTDWS